MEAFLINGEDRYSPLLGQGWKGVRLLGKGENGMVGLWEYEGSESKAVKQIAIKRSTYKATHSGPLREGIYMTTLSAAKSPHIVRQYREPLAVGIDGGSIVSLFLEYCHEGDTGCLELRGRGARMLEVDLWAMFYCLACAGVAIDRGTEDVKSPPVLHGLSDEIIVHYDLRPDNVFMGRRNPDHQRYPTLKVGDFGGALLEPRNPVDKSVYLEQRIRGALGYIAPESNDAGRMKSPRKGACSNTFQLGLVMHFLLKRNQSFPATGGRTLWKEPFTKPEYSGKYTMGADLFSEPWASLYSNTLRELIMECLMWEIFTTPGEPFTDETFIPAASHTFAATLDITDLRKFR